MSFESIAPEAQCQGYCPGTGVYCMALNDYHYGSFPKNGDPDIDPKRNRYCRDPNKTLNPKPFLAQP